MAERRGWRVTVDGTFPDEPRDLAEVVERVSAYVDARNLPLCRLCAEALTDEGIYINTEGEHGGESNADRVCSWACLTVLAARVVATAEVEENIERAARHGLAVNPTGEER